MRGTEPSPRAAAINISAGAAPSDTAVPSSSQVTAPATEAAARPGHLQRWRTSLHAQGALAVEGEAHIWRGGNKEKDKESGSSGSTPAGGSSQPGGEAAAKPQDKSGGSGCNEEAGGSEEPRRTKLATALERAKAADEEPALPLPRKQRRGKKGEAAQQPGGETAAAGAAAGDGEQHAALVDPGEEGAAPAQPAAGGSEDIAEQRPPQPQRQPGAGLESFIRPLEQMGERVSEMGERVSDMLHRHTHPQEPPQPAAGAAPAAQPDESGYVASSSSDAEEQGVQAASSTGSGSGSGSSASGGMGSPHASSLFGGLSSQTITATIQDSVALLQRVKDSVQQLTGNVQVRCCWLGFAGLLGWVAWTS